MKYEMMDAKAIIGEVTAEEAEKYTFERFWASMPKDG